MNEQKSVKLNGTNGHQVVLQPGIELWPTETIQLTQSAELVSTNQTLTLPRTLPGEYGYLIITIGPQKSDATMTLRTDAPDYFQLATDQRPAFKSSLTLLPSTKQTHIHVRYTPDLARRHTANLTVQTPDTTMTIVLVGQSTQSWTLGRKILVPVLALLGVLAYAVYSNPGQLIPFFRQGTVEQKPQTYSETSPGLPEKPSSGILPTLEKSRSVPVDQPIPALPLPTATNVATRKVSNQKDHIDESKTEVSRPSRQSMSSAPATTTESEESDLERVLNKKPRH